MLSLLFSSCWVGKGCEGTLRVWNRVLTPGILDYCIHCGQWLWFHAGEPGLECWCTLVCWSREWVVGWQKLASLGMHVLHCVFMCIIKNKLRTKDTCIHRLKKTIVTSQDDAVTSFPCLLGEFSPLVWFFNQTTHLISDHSGQPQRWRGLKACTSYLRVNGLVQKASFTILGWKILELFFGCLDFLLKGVNAVMQVRIKCNSWCQY